MNSRQSDLETLLAEGLRITNDVGAPKAIASDGPSLFDRPTAPGLTTGSGAASYPVGQLGRPTASLKPTWIDPEETPFTPLTRPGGRLSGVIVSLLFAALVIGFLTWILLPLVQERFALRDSLAVPNGLLTAEPISIGPLGPARVLDIYINGDATESQMLPLGTPIALLERETPTGTTETFELTVPFDAILVSVESQVGDIAYPGQPIAVVYDPTNMFVVIDETIDRVARLRRGMRVELVNEAIDKQLDGIIQSAVPLVGQPELGDGRRRVSVLIRPDSTDAAQLLPGIRLHAIIDLASVPDTEPSIMVMPVASDDS